LPNATQSLVSRLQCINTLRLGPFAFVLLFKFSRIGAALVKMCFAG